MVIILPHLMGILAKRCVKNFSCRSDLPGRDSVVWERDVVHHMNLHKTELDYNNSEVDNLKLHLFQLQVGQAQSKATDQRLDQSFII